MEETILKTGFVMASHWLFVIYFIQVLHSNMFQFVEVHLIVTKNSLRHHRIFGWYKLNQVKTAVFNAFMTYEVSPKSQDLLTK